MCMVEWVTTATNDEDWRIHCNFFGLGSGEKYNISVSLSMPQIFAHQSLFIHLGVSVMPDAHTLEDNNHTVV